MPENLFTNLRESIKAETQELRHGKGPTYLCSCRSCLDQQTSLKNDSTCILVTDQNVDLKIQREKKKKNIQKARNTKSGVIQLNANRDSHFGKLGMLTKGNVLTGEEKYIENLLKHGLLSFIIKSRVWE